MPLSKKQRSFTSQALYLCKERQIKSLQKFILPQGCHLVTISIFHLQNFNSGTYTVQHTSRSELQTGRATNHAISIQLTSYGLSTDFLFVCNF